MNPTMKFTSPPAAGRPLEASVPFSTRLGLGTKASFSPVVLGNRDFIRAWVARRVAKNVVPIRRDT
jgi:hypothetical protein